ncbi:hypothetical protein [Streptomyces noursei]|uniref:hypothetical protein n=1 Tax=Streptomyces noursei TaxID=1971 RepID=UPI0023B821FC|nr:hypothetical protein [Streptomyces noursei]
MSESVLRAARDGLPGHGLAPHTNRLEPTAHVLRRLLDHARLALERFGELSRVTTVLRRLAARGGGAERQRAAHAPRESLLDVVNHVAEHTSCSATWQPPAVEATVAPFSLALRDVPDTPDEENSPIGTPLGT